MHIRILYESWEAPFHKEHPLYAHLLYKFLNYMYESHFLFKILYCHVVRIAGFVLQIILFHISVKRWKKSFPSPFLCPGLQKYGKDEEYHIWYSEEEL